MAGCYHDEKDFKSDLNIEVAREGDILEAGQDLEDRKCNKNPGHRGFIPFKDLTLEHLPHEVRFTNVLENIKCVGSAVVRLVVDKINNGKRIKEVGTGFVDKKYNKYFIQTNNHVVGTKDDVEHCTVEFHYDSTDRSSVLTSRGVELVSTCQYKDLTKFTFDPLPAFLNHLKIPNIVNLPFVFIIDKHNEISIGETYFYTFDTFPLKFYTHQDLNSSLIDFMVILWPDDSFSYMKSLYFRFQPIPSNIQQLTSIEIRIAEDDGNIRVIPGDVVKFGDEFVVKISESILQDKVKKCRLVWNGEVIGRGTRLYFQLLKLTEMYSKVQVEFRTNLGFDEYCIFECHPLPSDTEDNLLAATSTNLCCIGHPHAGIKMVTFGHMLTIIEERFSYQGRRMLKPGSPDCKCAKVLCVKYSCKTCPGSSGSPVFGLYEKFKGIDAPFNHFCGERFHGVLPNGELIDNINTAWSPTDRILETKHFNERWTNL